MNLGRGKDKKAPKDRRSRPTAHRAGHDFPSPPPLGQEARTAAVESAIVSLNDTIRKLTAEIQRIDRIVEAKPTSTKLADLQPPPDTSRGAGASGTPER